MNPWNLTPREADVMDALIARGSYKAVSDSLGISKKTVEAHIGAAKKKMGSRSAIHHALQWDRWRRA